MHCIFLVHDGMGQTRVTHNHPRRTKLRKKVNCHSSAQPNISTSFCPPNLRPRRPGTSVKTAKMRKSALTSVRKVFSGLRSESPKTVSCTVRNPVLCAKSCFRLFPPVQNRDCTVRETLLGLSARNRDGREVRGVYGISTLIKNLLMPLFLMGCFPGDFREGKLPIKAFGGTAH